MCVLKTFAICKPCEEPVCNLGSIAFINSDVYTTQLHLHLHIPSPANRPPRPILTVKARCVISTDRRRAGCLLASRSIW